MNVNSKIFVILIEKVKLKALNVEWLFNVRCNNAHFIRIDIYIIYKNVLKSNDNILDFVNIVPD